MAGYGSVLDLDVALIIKECWGEQILAGATSALLISDQ
jgi:hypothetical protein